MLRFWGLSGWTETWVQVPKLQPSLEDLHAVRAKNCLRLFACTLRKGHDIDCFLLQIAHKNPNSHFNLVYSHMTERCSICCRNILGRCKLVVILLLGVIEQLGSLLITLLRLSIILDLLQESSVHKRTLLGHREAALDARAGQTAVQPRGDVGEQFVHLDARQHGDVGPPKNGDVGDGEGAAPGAGDVVAVFQTRVEDAVETLRLADVALDAVGDLLFGKAEEVVGLALPVEGRARLVGS